jgi:hypothetical protein
MSTFKKVLIGVVVLAIIFLAVMLFGTYSEGMRAGVIMKVSKKGVLFKTWEGQMNLETFGAVKSVNMVSETFDFSIEKGNQKLIDELNAAALAGERVNLKYKEKYTAVFWRGGTKYIAVGVERNANGAANKETKPAFPRK